MNLIENKRLTFIKAEATNTRLMGVVGLLAYFTDLKGQSIIQIYHLDYESYGIDGFYHLINPEERELENLILGVTGGLGGEFVPVSYDEFIFLIKSAYAVDESCLDTLVDFEIFEDQFESFYAALSLEEESALYAFLSPEIKSPEILLNYFLMRLIGADYKATLCLYKAGFFDESFELVQAPQTLIKNTISHKKTHKNKAVFLCESIVDLEENYALIVTEIEVDLLDMKVVKACEIERLTLSSIEAAFNLNVPEFMVVCTVCDAFFERRFAIQNPEMMKQNYRSGNLYIEFNKDNGHVGENPYRLSGDVYAMYYFTLSGQLLVCSLKAENIETLDAFFEENGVYGESLMRICEIRLDDPMLLTFANSSYDNFFDFLSGR